MSLPYPHDRARARQDDGQQPYKDAREAISEKESKLQAQARENGDGNVQESETERLAHMERDAVERLTKVGDELDQPNAPEHSGR